MAIAEPSSAGGLWPAVRPRTGWIASNEETVELLAGDWRRAGGDFAAAGGYPVDQFATLWADGVGGTYLDRARGNLATAASSAGNMVSLANKADRFAGEIKHVKNGINTIIDANREAYATLGAIPLVGGAAQSLFADAVAGLVNQLIDESAERVATQDGGAAPIAEPPPPGASPASVAAYWKSLSEDERRRLVRERPEWVGSQDGISAVHRDLANRVLLAREKAALTAERDRLFQEMIDKPDDTVPQAPRLTEINDELRGIAEIEGRLNSGSGYYLLGFDTMGEGRDARAIVARGNPDTAANVATYVPGAESGFEQMDRLLSETDSMYQSANRVSGPDSSVVMWLGYDAPDTAVIHAVSPAYAIEANQSLDRFQQGVQAVNPASHKTLVGHSYGSVVVGYAAKDGGLPVNDILAVGSPGMAVTTAAELGAERVWVLEANRDPVADTQAHGYDPGNDAFGARVLDADPEGRRPSDWWEYTIDSHLDYFYERPSSIPDGQTNPAYYNIGDVIAGRDPSHP